MVDFSQNCFYFVPKERIANFLNLPSTFDPKGYIICQAGTTTKIILYDYPVPEHAIKPDARDYVGKMGTRAEIKASDYHASSAESFLKSAKEKLDKVAKQFEI